MHVGMNRTEIPLNRSLLGVPHARGDEPRLILLGYVVTMSSPCTWG